jgi:hypothetical protein
VRTFMPRARMLGPSSGTWVFVVAPSGAIGESHFDRFRIRKVATTSFNLVGRNRPTAPNRTSVRGAELTQNPAETRNFAKLRVLFTRMLGTRNCRRVAHSRGYQTGCRRFLLPETSPQNRSKSLSPLGRFELRARPRAATRQQAGFSTENKSRPLQKPRDFLQLHDRPVIRCSRTCSTSRSSRQTPAT